MRGSKLADVAQTSPKRNFVVKKQTGSVDDGNLSSSSSGESAPRVCFAAAALATAALATVGAFALQREVAAQSSSLVGVALLRGSAGNAKKLAPALRLTQLLASTLGDAAGAAAALLLVVAASRDAHTRLRAALCCCAAVAAHLVRATPLLTAMDTAADSVGAVAAARAVAASLIAVWGGVATLEWFSLPAAE